MQTIIYSRNKPGHYDNWEKVFNKIIGSKSERDISLQILNIFRYNKIVFLDADAVHLLFFPLIIIRALIGKKNVLFSIRTELVLAGNFRAYIQKIIFKFLKNIKNTIIISIHKDGQVRDLKKYVNNFIYDIQYWDLNFLDIVKNKPPEFNKNKIDSNKKIVVVFGGLSKKTNKEEWFSFLNQGKHGSDLNFTIIFAGNSKFTPEEKKSLSDNIIIDRFIQDEEMFYLYNIADYICVYRNKSINFPSGMFGRAIQLGKKVIVKQGGYLAMHHKNYIGLFPIKCLAEINGIIDTDKIKKTTIPNYDDSKLVKELINN